MEISTLPFTISECGYYEVTCCLEGVAGKHGITIEGDVKDVTIDLGGYSLIGVEHSLDGIHAESIAANIVVRNGTVRDWGGEGIDLSRGWNGRVTNVQSVSNGGTGILAADGCLIDQCQVRDNGGDGINAQRCAVISNCVSSLNQGDGIIGGWTQDGAGGINSGSVVRSCTSCFNFGYGIRVAPASLVTDCAAVQNTGGGIAAEQALVRGNSVGGSIDLTAATATENHQF